MECPECGRQVVELASVDDPEETEIDEPEPVVLENPIQEPIEVTVPSTVLLEVEEHETTEERPELPDAQTDLEPPPEPVEVAITADVEDEDEETSVEIDPPVAEEPLPVLEELDVDDDVELGDIEDVADLAADEEEEDLTEVQDLVEDSEDEDDEEVIGEVAGPAEEEEAHLEQFLAGAKRFTRIVALEDPVGEVSLRDSNVSRGKPVRWAHRAYRGDVDVISAKSSRVVTLAVFGDGLLLVEAPGRPIGGLLPAFGGRRSARKIVSRAGSSADAAAHLGGSRRLATPDIHSVRIAKGRARAHALTIRTTQGEELQYRFASKRYRQVLSLLSSVLGPKLRDMPKGEKAPRRAG